MDSGNSGSIQSSSGGDEEYDSRAESISALLNPTKQPPPHHHHPNSSMFESLSNYFNPFPPPPPPPLTNTNPPVNFDAVWPKAPRSEPNCTEIKHPFFSSPPTVLFPPMTESTITITAPEPDRTAQLTRNPKKRSRASRRAPTTVLTTDTANFRAMVQEFTGIPAPPFASSSPFPKSRLDLFGTTASTRFPHPFADLLPQPPPPPYLLRPFAQKFQPPQPFDPNSIASASNSNPNEFQMQNQILSLQSLLQSAPPKHPLANPSILGSKAQESLGIGSSEFGFSQTQLSGLPNLVASDGTGDQGQRYLRSVNESYEYSEGGANGRLVNYSGSLSGFGGEKESENVPNRGEGMAEPWICSSDH